MATNEVVVPVMVNVMKEHMTSEIVVDAACGALDALGLCGLYYLVMNSGWIRSNQFDRISCTTCHIGNRCRTYMECESHLCVCSGEHSPAGEGRSGRDSARGA